jgi:hypothetical protein
MVEYKEQYGSLGLDEMIKTILNKTWKSPRRKGMEGLIQMQTEQVLLTYLLALSVDEDASFITRSIVQKSLHDLKLFLEQQQKNADPKYTGHLLFALERMKKPETAKPTIHVSIPPGAPIGCEEDQW